MVVMAMNGIAQAPPAASSRGNERTEHHRRDEHGCIAQHQPGGSGREQGGVYDHDHDHGDRPQQYRSLDGREPSSSEGHSEGRNNGAEGGENH